MSTSLKNFVKRLAGLVGLRVFSLAIVFLQTIALTRLFGPEVFGQYSFAMSLGTIAMLALSMGLDQVLMRDLARIGVNKAAQSAKWAVTYLYSIRLALVVSLVAAVLGVLLFGATEIGGQYKWPLVIVFALMPVMIARKFVESLLLGAHRPGASLVGTHLSQPVVMIAGVGIVMLLQFSSDISSLLTISVFSTFASALAVLWLARRLLRQVRPTPGADLASLERRTLLMSGASFSLITLGFVIGQHIDVLLVGAFGGPEDAGLVRIATRLAEMAGLIRAIVVLQFKPRIAATHANGDPAGVQKIANQMALIFLLSGLPIALGLWVFAEEAMSVFGAEFAIGAWPMRVYVLGVFVTMLCGPCTLLMTLCDHEHVASRILWASLAIQVVLDCILIPLFGPLGCAVSNCLSLLIMSVSGVIMTRRRLGVNTSVLGLIWR